MSDTPRTDLREFDISDGQGAMGVTSAFARELERQLAAVTAERDRLIAERAALMVALYEWKKWADMGIEDFLPEWVKPVLHDTYEKTKEILK